MCTIGALVRFLGFAALIGLSLSILGASTAASADSVSAAGKHGYDGSAARNELKPKGCSARAPLFGHPVITFCGFTCRTRTILIRILGWHFDAVAVLSLGYRAAADRAHRLLSWCLSKAV